MKDKIFTALKQEYTHLGLGDEILTAQAESLASTGLVTDENLNSVVASQKAFLEAMQKDNDRRVSAALAKNKKEHDDAKAKAESEHAAALKAETDKLEAMKAELEDAKAKLKKAESKEGGGNPELEKLIDSKMAEVNETIKKLAEANKSYEEQIKTMKDAKEAEVKAAAVAARKERIAKMAKEKGIPEWISAHGFADITDEMTDEQVEEKLNGYAQEIKTNFLPNKDGKPQFDGKQATKADTDAMLKKVNF